MFVIRLGILVSFLFLSLSGFSQIHPGYYGEDFYQSYKDLKDQALIAKLNLILRSKHTAQKSGYDQIIDQCRNQSDCPNPEGLNYRQAREVLFGKLHLKLGKEAYYVSEVYCGFQITSKQTTVGPGLIPHVDFINAEHTWPQSRFTSRYSKEMQKTDLHNLFPSDTEMNSHRSSLRFGHVVEETEELKCTDSKLGHSQRGEIVFEPPNDHKGNVARAIFYFAARYEMKINDQEESTLREWHLEDPVDEEESIRNEQIFEIQKVRNPFIDFPDALDKIADF